MFKTSHPLSTVTAILPEATAEKVMGSVLSRSGSSALTWASRGSLLNNYWHQRWFPPISPTRTMLQMLIPNQEIDGVVAEIVEVGNLHLQATGAVFSTRCEHVYLGSEFHAWPASTANSNTYTDHKLDEQLSIIYCIVGHRDSDKVARAAVNAGTHGPIVHYTEGLGLRDRLGWLRITKEHEKEVLMVIVDQADVEEVFDVMAKAGQLHLPGRGFMYRMSIDKGMYNLPSRVSHHHYAASMQQMIDAIDHLAGHSHWRDQKVVDFSADGKCVGLEFLKSASPILQEQTCLSAIVHRDYLQELMDLMLDAGAPGLNINHTRFVAMEHGQHSTGARINQEYSLLRCIVDQVKAEQICAAVDAGAESSGIRDLCMLVQSVPRVATYIPGFQDFRKQRRDGQSYASG